MINRVKHLLLGPPLPTQRLAQEKLNKVRALAIFSPDTLVAANTSFAGFPRVAALLAADGFLPRQLYNLGDRLVFANGILLLAIISGGLIAAFGADTHSLIPLFAIGAFLAFTLSQAGMVVHWWRERGKGWQLKASLKRYVGGFALRPFSIQGRDGSGGRRGTPD